MIHRTRRPGPPLSEFVDLLWVWTAPPQPHARERLLPTGRMDVIVNLAEDAVRVWDDEGRVSLFGGAVVGGAYSKHSVIETAQQRDVAGIHFLPGGAFPFLGVPAGDVSNRDVSLADVWGRGADRLRERLLAAPTPEARLDVLESSLLERVTGSPRERSSAVAWALREFDRAPGAATINGVCGRLGFDRKRFLSRFRDEVGLSPKRYCRVRRFQETIARARAGRRIDWIGVALSCGYFDQAHLIRDFKAFSGLTPTAWVAQRGPHQNHVPIPD